MTKNKGLINFDLSKIMDGALQEKFIHELQKVSENILDPNTDPGVKRKITIDLTYLPNDNREAIGVGVVVKSKLAPQSGVSTTMLVGRDSKGVLQANELKSGVPGQTYFDIDDEKLKTDTNQPVDEIENSDKPDSEKVIDLQKNNKKA